jgi:cellulose biosynthesis protein BcsQ
LIVISSLSGGVGKSVIALNLAERLSEFSKKVLLLDLSFNNGTLTHLFQESLYENTSLDSLFESYIKFGSISLEDVEQTIVTRPTFKNLNTQLNSDFIFTIQNNINVKKIQNSPQFVSKLINLLTSIYDYVIIDNSNINNFINEFLLVYAQYYLYIFNHINDFIKIKELYSGENVYIIKNNSYFQGDLDKLYKNIFEIPNIEGLKSNFENGKELFFDSRLLDKVVKELCL